MLVQNGRRRVGKLRWIAAPPKDRTYYINGVLSDVTTLKMAEGEAELQRRQIARLMRQSDRMKRRLRRD